jgi:hypothetical protein
LYSNGKIKPNLVIVSKDERQKDIEETHPEGAYYLYHDGQWIPVGADALEAQFSATPYSTPRKPSEYLEWSQRRAPRSCRSPAKRTLADAVQDWVTEIEANKKHKTYLAYKKSTEYFLQCCKKARRRPCGPQRLAELQGLSQGQESIQQTIHLQ